MAPAVLKRLVLALEMVLVDDKDGSCGVFVAHGAVLCLCTLAVAGAHNGAALTLARKSVHCCAEGPV